MDWQVDEDWICEICNTKSRLVWGMVHAECRCNNCHAIYIMRDDNGNRITKPIINIKDDYIQPAKDGYVKLQKPIDEFTKEEWNDLKKDTTKSY